MNMQRSRLVRQSMAEEQRRLDAARQAFLVSACADENEVASFYEATGNTLIFMQRAQERLRYLEESATAIENRLHSLCEDCGEEISQRRLAARPETRRCADCQAEWEEEQKCLYPILGADKYNSHLYNA